VTENICFGWLDHQIVVCIKIWRCTSLASFLELEAAFNMSDTCQFCLLYGNFVLGFAKIWHFIIIILQGSIIQKEILWVPLICNNQCSFSLLFVGSSSSPSNYGSDIAKHGLSKILMKVVIFDIDVLIKNLDSVEFFFFFFNYFPSIFFFFCCVFFFFFFI